MSRAATQRRSSRQPSRRRAKRNRRTMIGLVVAGIIILGLAGLLVVRQLTPAVPGEERIADQGGGLHLDNQTDQHAPYNSNPPTSGFHWGGGTAPWGVLGQPVADELMVHNLEHGGVVFSYRQGLDQATVDRLTTLTGQLQRQNQCIVLVPRPSNKIDAPIVATAWNYLLKLQNFDADMLTRFFQAHVGRGFEPVCRR